MKSEAVKENLNAIRDYVSAIGGLKESKEVQLLRSQLRVIEKGIRQLERSGIQVPQGLMSDKVSLESKITQIEKAPEEITLVYEELLDIVSQMGSMIGRRPRKDLRDRSKELKKSTVPKEVLHKTILGALEEMGGEAGERDVMKFVGNALQDQFAAADLERPYGKMARWQMNVRSERNRMIKQGILTPESKRKKWALIK